MMNSIALELEKKHQQKSAKISIIIHLILLLLALFIALPKTPREPEKENFAVAVQFIDFKPSSLSKYAHADEGAKRPKTEEVKVVPPKKVEKIEIVEKPKEDIPKEEPQLEPEPIDPIVSEILQEDSELEAIEEEIEVEDPEPEPIPEPEVEEAPEIEEEPVEEEPVEETSATPTASESDASESSEDPANPSSIEGEAAGTGKGDSGDGAGASSGNDGDEGMGDEGTGTGEMDGSGDGIFGRKVIYRNTKDAINSATKSGNGKGKVVAKVCINRRGIPDYAEIDEYETTISDPAILKAFLKAIRGYRYEEDRSAAAEQCGRLVFNWDIDVQQMNSFKRDASADMKRAAKGGAELNRFKRKYKGLTPAELKKLTVGEYKRIFRK